MIKDIDPENAVDRDVEQEEFRNLLTLQEKARLLIIQDREGTGKTTLLRRLHYNCRRVETPRVPAGMVDLENREIASSFDLILSLRNSLEKVKFDEFDQLNRARVNKDSKAFSGAYGRISQAFQGASFSGGQQSISGVGIGTQNVSQQTIIEGAALPWSEEQEELARQECIQAFFKDLKVITESQTVVLLIDHLDKMANKELQEWIQDELVYPLCFDLDNRPARFVLVLAGRELPGFNALIKAKPAFYGDLIRSKTSLSEWSDEHVKEFLMVNGITGLKDEYMDDLVEYVRKKVPIKFVIHMADGFRLISG
jgi:Cdc6-like AAA superfamily ATPase